MQRPLSLFLALCLVVALVATSCRKDEDNPVKPGTNQPTVTTTIAGVVSDENGNGIQGISIQAHGKTATTNQNGLFVIKDARVPKDRCFVLARKNGYFTASRAEQPKAGGVTHMRLSMMGNTPQYSVEASTGGKVSLGGGGSVDLPANGYVLANGQAYTGTVRVAARWLNPTSSSFYGFFPGDFTAQRTDNSQTELYSYGVLNVELSSASGDKVQLASGKKATLTYPIPSAMQAGAPTDMPLWYFDEELGMWKEDGKAVRQGTVYTGEVSHFTSWNCSEPIGACYIEGRVICNSMPVPHILIQIGYSEFWSDENGFYKGWTVAGRPFEIKVDARRNMESGTQVPISMPALGIDQVVTQDIIVSPCPAYLTGTLVDCNGNPTEGVVQIMVNSSPWYTITQNGQFTMRVPFNIPLIVQATGYNTAEGESIAIQQVTSGTTYNIGNVELCPQNVIDFTDIDIDGLDKQGISKMKFSPDATMVAAWYYGGEGVRIYNTQTGNLIKLLDVSNADLCIFSRDGTKFLSGGFSGSSPVRIWDVSSWQEIRSFPNTMSAVFTPNGASILAFKTNPLDTVLVQYSIATGAELARYTVPRTRYQQIVGVLSNGLEFVYMTFAANGVQPKAIVWDMGTNTLVREMNLSIEVYPPGIHLSYDASHLAAFGDWGYYFYNTATGQRINDNVVFQGTSSYSCVLLSDNAHYIKQKKPNLFLMPPGIYSVVDDKQERLLPAPAGAAFRFFDQASNLPIVAGLYYLGSTSQYRIRIWHLP